MYILAHIWFYFLVACVLLSCCKAWNAHSGNALPSSVSAIRTLWKHDCISLMTEVVNSLGRLSSSASQWYLFKCRRTEHFTTCYLWPDEIMCLPYSYVLSVFLIFRAVWELHFMHVWLLIGGWNQKSKIMFIQYNKFKIVIKLWRLVETSPLDITLFFQILSFFFKRGILWDTEKWCRWW